MLANSHQIKLYLKLCLSQYPFLFRYLYTFSKNKSHVVKKRNTDLVIEGFPRSANSFLCQTIKELTNKKIRIASHLHFPFQIECAVKENIPVILLIRNPRDAIASLVLRDGNISVKLALFYYLVFHKRLLPYRNHIFVVEFRVLTENINNVIININKKYGFQIPVNNKIDVKEIFEILKNSRDSERFRKKFGNDYIKTVSAPSKTKEDLKKGLYQKIDKYPNLLQKAEHIYCQLSSQKNL